MQWGKEEEKWDYVGVAHIIRAFGWLAVTDMHGEVIVDQAFDPTDLPSHIIYNRMLDEAAKQNIRTGIEYLETGQTVPLVLSTWKKVLLSLL